MDRDTITALTIAIRVYRKLRAMGVYDAMELKRIKGDALTARANIEKLGKLYSKLAQTSGEHATDVESLVGDVGEMVDDMGAIVDLTKNSVASSNAGEVEKPKDSVKPPAAVQQPEPPQTHPEPVSGPQEVGQASAATFPTAG